MPNVGADNEICINHFNDVYHISQVDLIARFGRLLTKQKLGRSQDEQPLTIFSGDCFSPSLEATISRGKYMASVLNHLKVDVACYGNHDFDFGEERLQQLSELCNFPWTLCNARRNKGDTPRCVSVPSSDDLLADSQSYVIKRRKGYKIGFFGLAGTDWPLKCQGLPPSQFEDPVQMARVMANYLRTVERCDLVIAITHMRLNEDIQVSQSTCNYDATHIDLLLGGHDHEVVCRFQGDTDADAGIIQQGHRNIDIVRDGCARETSGDIRIVKSGTDFRGFSSVKLKVGRRADGTAFISNVRLRQVVDLKEQPHYGSISPLPPLKNYLSSVQQCIGSFIQSPVLRTKIPLEGRSAFIRSQETNLGNLIADAVNAFHGSQIALINSGTIRSDTLLGSSSSWSRRADSCPETNDNMQVLQVKDVIDMTPFHDEFVVKRVRGSSLLSTLENSVSDDGADGRFLQCSGVRFSFDRRRPAGARIIEAYHVPNRDECTHGICTENESWQSNYWSGSQYGNEKCPIKLSEYYTVTVSSFLARGFDGYECLRKAETLGLPPALKSVTQASLMLHLFSSTLTLNDYDDDENSSSLFKGPQNATRNFTNNDRTALSHYRMDRLLSNASSCSSSLSDTDPGNMSSDSSIMSDDTEASSAADQCEGGDTCELHTSQSSSNGFPPQLSLSTTVQEGVIASRKRIVVGYSSYDGLPIINPQTEGRIVELGEDR